MVQDSPAPQAANPATAAAAWCVRSAPASPTTASRPHRRTSPAGPYRVASRSPASRPATMPSEKPANPATANQPGVRSTSRR